MTDPARSVVRLRKIAQKFDSDAQRYAEKSVEARRNAKKAREWAEAITQEVIQRELGEL